MILTCPSCATSYFTPDEAIGPGGRTVRCKTCKHTWRATLEEPLELSAAPPGVEPARSAGREEAVAESPSDSLAETPAPELPRAFRARAEQQRRLRRAATHGVVWAGIASGFAALAASAWLFRVEVVELAPRTAAAYAAVGLTVNPTGLEFEAISARAAPNDPGKVLVSGALRNVRDEERIAPPVRVALLDRAGAEIGHAVVRIDAAPVLPGKVQGFAAVIPDPGGKGEGVGVAFVLEETAPAPARRSAPPVQRPLPRADHAAPVVEAAAAPAETGLRPALLPDPATVLDMQPIDAVPLPIDSHGSEAVSASHG
ncbi:zinc-ribbon domain-containing protein [Roseibacterium beibuensis]|uniref:MJ0042-type zinc finger domain-containing protein n=1 Tax=[Roseibacterium] beibuensis TaxID=1193142 RepID=UPI00217E4217|nr:MJ0042-type zinc finger domain-containing protein [Roseibacterium beibuensis]MCS6626209.1 zinc-ribbon domain-containing protein [Roseibacterium beibuensis]